ncbi:MAG: glycerophosphoryl diester phosphodiesterase [Sphingomonadales bacterium]|jgi:glycerophosphoryl diester phosphodiesterase|nr:glycerophosphoryl diester phosphodiesterase [Sphingomonadales bacterium]
MSVENDEEKPAPRRRSKWRPALIAVALIAVPLSLLNASWLAPRPPGRLIVLANRGIALPFDHRGIDNDSCTAQRIRPPGDNNYIENTLPSIYRARRLGADAVEVQVHPTKDGRMVVFHDWTLDCRTDGHGAVREHTLAELKKLDVGYGYTADGGKTFPLRGRGIGGMPTVEELLREVPGMRIVFAFKSKDPRDADALAAAFGRAGVAIDDKYGFFGDPAVLARMKQLAPGGWTFSAKAAGACLKDYLKLGWSGYTPPSCRDTTVVVPLNDRWALWGWPYRFLARMAKANTRVLIYGDGAAPLERPEQYDQVPADFHGWLWVDDFYTMGPALRR